MNLGSLGDATLVVNSASSADLTVPRSGQFTIAGESWRASGSEAVFYTTGGAQASLAEGDSASVGGNPVTFLSANLSNIVVDGAASATFRIQETFANGATVLGTETIYADETTTVSLSGFNADMRIIDSTVVNNEVVSVTVYVEPTNTLFSSYTQNVTFEIGEGKRVSLSDDLSYDVYLESVEPSVADASIDSVSINLNGQIGSFSVPDVAILEGRTVFVEGVTLQEGVPVATVRVGADVIAARSSGQTQRFDNNAGGDALQIATDATNTRSNAGVTFDLGSTDVLFGSFRLESTSAGIMAYDGRVEEQFNDGTSAGYRFTGPGSFTVTGTATDERGNTGQDSVTIVVN